MTQKAQKTGKLEIKAVEKRYTRRICVQRAEVGFEETGEKEIVTVMTAEGKTETREKPIVRQVSKEAKYIDQEAKRPVFEVNDGTDTHEFVNRSQAEEFIRLSRR